jgi:hypothetical protein
MAATLFILFKTWKQTKCPFLDQWISKTWCINCAHARTRTHAYSHAVRLLNLKKDGNATVTWVNLENIMLSGTGDHNRKRTTSSVLFLREGVLMLPRLTSNFWAQVIFLLHVAGPTGTCHCTQLNPLGFGASILILHLIFLRAELSISSTSLILFACF